ARTVIQLSAHSCETVSLTPDKIFHENIGGECNVFIVVDST
ncbi:unnamed protein product, partial [Hapterophycus canaliculatus]